MAYIGNAPDSTYTINTKEYIATAGQTTFSAVYDDSVRVYVNGLLLASSDYTATDGFTVVLNTGVTTGDVVRIDGYADIATVSGVVTSVAGKTGNVELDTADVVGLDTVLSSKQDVLVNGDSIKTINGGSILGSGNITVEDTKGANIASDTTTTIGTTGLGNLIHITGTTTITSLGTASAVGIRRTLVFDGALTLTHNANLLCPNNVSIVTLANTAIEVVAETTSIWRVVGIAHPSISFSDLGSILTKLDNSGGIMTGAITAIRETKVAMATNVINLATGNLFTKTITAATTFTVSGVLATGNANSFILELTNGGSQLVTWWSGMKWAGGTTPALTTSGVDILGFYSHDGGTTWRGVLMSKDSK